MFVHELQKGRKVHIVDRNTVDPKIREGVIIGIVSSNGSHYLRVNTNREVIRVQIAGASLPETLLNKSIFFEASSAREELDAYKEFAKRYSSKHPKNMGM